ncbi:MAG TPA: hypothetical protein VMV59_06105 [Candidatus Dormibacteraeota bacterium]|nr:hypothetical protein [Candidatus Dormibacteraeota bacterium]
MNRQQAIEFIQALNMLQPHVAPILFSHIASGDVVRLAGAVANGQAVCDVKSVVPKVDGSEA